MCWRPCSWRWRSRRFSASPRPVSARSGSAPRRPGVTAIGKQQQAIANPPASADLVYRIGGFDAPLPAFWVDVRGDRVSAILAGQWFLAFTDTWTLEANAVASGAVLGEPAQIPAVAEQILLSRPDAVVVVRSEYADAVRRAVGPFLAPRIVGL